ncbi:MAG: T9SS type A sorting domain-containing protein [Bacteroidales bacterium]|nr:T9SS type A sorting domain-containing protein [Bacteroidales bacterium]
MGIDKGNTNEDVIAFDSIYGIQYPSVSGQDGGGNEIHLLYDIQVKPTIVVINPDKLIAYKQIYPPSTANVVDSVTAAGGIQQPCLTSVVAGNKIKLLAISPNPVRNVAFLSLNNDVGRNLDIRIINLTGQLVAVVDPRHYQKGKHIVRIDLSDNPEGFYFVQITENNRVVITKKLLLIN